MAKVARRRFSFPKAELRVYHSRLKQCCEADGESGSLREGRRVHALLADIGYDRYAYFANLLIEMYGRCGCVEDAESVLAGVVNPSIVTTSTMIDAYAANGSVGRAERLFMSIPRKAARHWRSMIKLYSQNNDLRAAWLVFEASAPRRDHRVWNSVITAFAQHGQLQRAMACFHKMPYRTERTYRGLIAASVRAGDLLTARSVLDANPRPYTITWNDMIRGYATWGEPGMAMVVFRTMSQWGEPPNRATFLRVFNAVDSPAEARALELCVREAGLFRDVPLTIALIRLYTKLGSMVDAVRTFKRSKSRGVLLWTLILHGFSQNADYHAAVDTFRQMNNEGALPSDLTMLALLVACCANGSPLTVVDCFKSMEPDYLVRPGVEHYICVVEFLACRGRLTAAKELVLCMPFEPVPEAWMVIDKAVKLRAGQVQP